MNELNFVGSLLCFIPATYLAFKFFHLHRGINNYTQQVQSLNGQAPENSSVPLKPNLTLIRCQKCNIEELPEQNQTVASI